MDHQEAAAAATSTQPLRIVALSASDFIALSLLVVVVLYVLPRRIQKIIRQRASKANKSS
jgi:hypothetical protein